MPSIPKILYNFKENSLFSSKLRELLLLLIIFLVAGASFGIGRLSLQEGSSREIQVREQQLPAVSAAAYAALQEQRGESTGENSTPGSVEVLLVASRNGETYSFAHCTTASRINDENKIYFDSYEKARVAGYRAAKNCPGLE